MRKPVTLLVASALLGAVSPAFSQDAVKVSPGMYTVLLENEHVRVLEFRAKAGEKEPLHSHPAVVAYNISDHFTGHKIRVTSPGGKAEEFETKPGGVFYGEAVTHVYENLGPGDAHELIIELKDRPAAKAAAK